MVNIIAIFVIALVVGGAGIYIIRAKKRGKRCIGCPQSSCGECHCCSKNAQKTE